VFSCLGEALWYIAGSDKLEFIEYYVRRYREFSDDKVTLYGAYGPRLFRMRRINQLANVTRKLRDETDTRQAVVQLFDARILWKNTTTFVYLQSSVHAKRG